MTTNRKPLRSLLKQMPAPEPRPAFVDEAIAHAVKRVAPRVASSSVFARRETWLGAAMGATAALVVALFIVKPGGLPADRDPTVKETNITLAQDESRTVDVLIDSERTLEDATIKIAASGAVELDGLEDTRQVQWRTRLDRGRNVVSLPVVGKSPGTAELVATIEHEGRARRVAVKMIVKSSRQKVA